MAIKLARFIRRSLAVENRLRFALYRAHIIFKLDNCAGKYAWFCFRHLAIRAVGQFAEHKTVERRKHFTSEISAEPPSVIEPYSAVVVYDCGVVCKELQNRSTVFIFDIAEIFKRTVRTFRNGDRHRAECRCVRPRSEIVEIIFPVISSYAIGCIVICKVTVAASRILRFQVGFFFAAPRRKV